jgi:hypothetical protein
VFRISEQQGICSFAVRHALTKRTKTFVRAFPEHDGQRSTPLHIFISVRHAYIKKDISRLRLGRFVLAVGLILFINPKEQSVGVLKEGLSRGHFIFQPFTAFGQLHKRNAL